MSPALEALPRRPIVTIGPPGSPKPDSLLSLHFWSRHSPSLSALLSHHHLFYTWLNPPHSSSARAHMKSPTLRPTALSLVFSVLPLSELLSVNQYTLFMPFYIMSQRKKGQELIPTVYCVRPFTYLSSFNHPNNSE